MNVVGSWLPTLGATAVASVMVFRRARRLLTRQRFSLPRLGIRVALLGAVSATLLVVLSAAAGLAPTLGLAAGAVLGFVGFRLTRFESIEGELHYTPNGVIGIAILVLLVGRLAYRVLVIRGLADTAAHRGDPAALAALAASPLTAGLVFLLLGYYLCYYTAVMGRCLALRGAG